MYRILHQSFRELLSEERLNQSQPKPKEGVLQKVDIAFQAFLLVKEEYLFQMTCGPPQKSRPDNRASRAAKAGSTACSTAGSCR